MCSCKNILCYNVHSFSNAVGRKHRSLRPGFWAILDHFIFSNFFPVFPGPWRLQERAQGGTLDIWWRVLVRESFEVLTGNGENRYRNLSDLKIASTGHHTGITVILRYQSHLICTFILHFWYLFCKLLAGVIICSSILVCVKIGCSGRVILKTKPNFVEMTFVYGGAII